MMIDLRDYLLIDFEFISEFTELLKESLVGVILLFFVLAIIYEMVNNGDLMGVLKRLFLCIVVISTFSAVHHFAVNSSFKIANDIANNLSDNTSLLKGVNDCLDEAIEKRKKASKDRGAWVWIKYNLLLGSELSSLYITIIIFLAKILLLLTKTIYTVAHNINYGLIAIPCAFCILPPFKGSLAGALKTTAWCMVMPFVVLFLLMMISWEMTNDVGNTLDHAAITFCFLIMLILSGGITWGILSGTGVMGAAAIGGALLGSQISSMAIRPLGRFLSGGSGQAVLGQGIRTGNKMTRGFKNSAMNMISPLVTKNNGNISSKKNLKNSFSDDINKNQNLKQITPNREMGINTKNITRDKSSTQKNHNSSVKENSHTTRGKTGEGNSKNMNRQVVSNHKKENHLSNKRQGFTPNMPKKVKTMQINRSKNSENTTSKRKLGVSDRSNRLFQKRLETENFKKRLRDISKRPRLDQ